MSPACLPHNQRVLRLVLLMGAASVLAACGGGGGEGVKPIAPPPLVGSPLPPLVGTPPPPSGEDIDYDTTEYQRSKPAMHAQAISAWNADATGAGVTIAVIDSGIHIGSEEFSGRISSASRDVTNLGRTVADVDGHGTSVAAVAAAARNDTGHMGIAFDATVLALRADNGDCSDGCYYYDSDIAKGVNAAVAANAKVINISLGGSSISDASLRTALANATAAGVVIVVAAGNDGTVEVDPLPAASLQHGGTSNIIIAGSIDSAGVISTFSNMAGKAQNNYLMAVGESVRSFDHLGAEYYFGGTSYAAPTISGAVALMAQAFPELTGAQIVELLLSSATDAGDTGTDSVYGRGLLNLARAMAPAGATILTGTQTPVSLENNGSLGAAFGDGLSQQEALSRLPITDSYGRQYNLALGQTLRPSSAGKLAARLQHMNLQQAHTQTSGPINLALTLRASDSFTHTGADWFRDQDAGTSHLGLAHRGVDARAGQRNPLRETRLSLRHGMIGFTAATGKLASETLPGAAHTGFISDDGLQLDDGTGTAGRQVLMADVKLGQFTIATASETRKAKLRHNPQLAPSTQQQRHIVALSWQNPNWMLAAHLARGSDSEALLGTRLAPTLGISGSESQLFGAAAAYQLNGYRLRVAATHLTLSPEDSGYGLFQRAGNLSAQSWSVSGQAPFMAGWLLASVSQPLAVTHGHFHLNGGTPVAVGVKAAERAVEIGYQQGALSVAGFTRRNAGHFEGLTDNGAALSWKARF